MKPELNDGAMSLFSWQAGQKPNLGMIFLGGLCTCSITPRIILFNLYKEMNRFFPEYDKSSALLKVIFLIWAWLTLDSDLNNLAKKAGVQLPPPKLPAIAALCCGILAPLIVCDMLDRANILFKAISEKAE